MLMYFDCSTQGIKSLRSEQYEKEENEKYTKYNIDFDIINVYI
mgnify:CR=1 FL=1